MKWLVFILGIGFLLRVAGLALVPPGLSHDELDMVVNGYSILKTGRDLSGELLPLTVGGTGLVAVPAVVAGVGATLFGFTPTGVRVMAAVLGTVNLFLIYRIALSLSGSRKASLFGALFFAVSPWGIHFSRMMYDPPVALFFALLGIERYLTAKTKIDESFGAVALGLALISYYGFIFVIPPLFMLLLWYRHRENLSLKTAGLSLFILLGFLGVLGLMLMLPGHTKLSGERNSEIIFSNTEEIAEMVDIKRSYTSGHPLNALFVNKGSEIATQIAGNYLSAFNPEMLFSFGEPSEILSLREWGFLYLLDIPLIIIGAYHLYRTRRREALFVFGIIAIAPITIAISDRTYGARAALMFPMLFLLAGFGASRLLRSLGQTPYVLPRIAVSIFSILYIVSIAGFLFQYHVRYPVYAREIWFDSEKQVAEYIVSNPQKLTVVSTPEVKDTFLQYFFYARLDPTKAQTAMTTYPIANLILYDDKVMFMSCIDPEERKDHEVTLILDHTCGDISEADEYIYSREGANTRLWGIYR